MAVAQTIATDDSLGATTDALLMASRSLVAISAGSIAPVEDTITIPQFRTLEILSRSGREATSQFPPGVGGQADPARRCGLA